MPQSTSSLPALHRVIKRPAACIALTAQVLETPLPRWSTRDAAALKIEVPGGLAKTVQERAWTSPIWSTAESAEQ